MSGLPAGATQVVPLTFEETVRQAGTILGGTVTSRQSRWGDASQRWMVTDYTLTVDDVLYDAGGEVAAGATVVITYWGGTINGETQQIAHMRLPAVGESLIVMLRSNWRTEIGFAPTVGLNQGLFAVQRAGASDEGSVTDAEGRPLFLSSDGAVVRAQEAQTIDLPQVGLAAFSAWIEDNVKRIKATPAKPVIDPPNDVPLYSKTPALLQPGAPEGLAAPVEDAGVIAVPNAPASSRSIIAGTDSVQVGRSRGRHRVASQYSSFGQASLPIVVNGFPSSFTAWSLEDQYQMAKWNYYGDVFRVYATPTGTFEWRDGIFDLAGWPSSATLASVYGSGWDANTIGVTFSRFNFFGQIVEADIALNPAFGFTLDDEWVYEGSSAQGFRQVMLHELGHMHGLEHNFSYLAVMNYFPSAFRAFGLPYTDDAEGIRAEYPGAAISRTDLGVHLYYSSGYQSVSDATYPFSATAGSSFTVNNYHVENVGTTTIATPTIEWYLSSARNFGSTHYYLGTATYSQLPRFNYFEPSTVSRTLTVPANVPSGSYYLGAYVRDDGGAGQSSFPFSNNYAFSRRTIFVSGTLTCSSFSINPTAASPGSAAGSQGVTITGSPSGCQGGSWSASGNGSWITVSPSSGSGSGVATVFWSQNTSPTPRSGSATIAGNAFAVFQAGTSGGNTRVRGDFNADGRSDIFWRKAIDGETSIWFMNGAGSPGTIRSTTVPPSWTPSLIGDFDGDGRADLWWRNAATGETSAWLGWNGSIFTTQVRSLTVSTAWVPAGTGDFNADGKTDIFWRNASTGQTSIWFMNGAMYSSTALATTLAMPWRPGPFGDFDGDGRGDVFWRNPSTGQTAIWLGWNGAAFTTQTGSITVPVAWAPLAAGDINGGGRADVFWFNAATGETSIWFMNGATVATAVRATTVPLGWSPSPAGDYDGDGRIDIFWRHAASGNTSVWLGWNGTAFGTQLRSLTVPTTWAPFASP